MDRYIQQCEHEALHRSGSILPHGTLLVADRNARITHHAANFADFCGLETVSVGQPAPSFLLDFIALPDEEGSRKMGQIEIGDGMLDVSAARNGDGHVVIELTRAQGSPGRIFALDMAISSPEEESIQRELLCQEISVLTGFERVMYYKFREDEDGEVVAESCSDSTHGRYVGLRFPASDIPRIARSLFMKNPWRHIPDAAADPVNIIGAPPPDLTYSDLRSASPVHRIYLANMGVRAALSFPIVTGNFLNALISCHHGAPMTVSLELLAQIAERVRSHARSLTSYQATRRLKFIDSLDRRFGSASKILDSHGGDALAAWKDLGEFICLEFEADGAVLCLNGRIEVHGQGFEPDALEAIESRLASSDSEFVWVIDNLSRHIPGFPVSHIAGTLAFRAGRARIYICRTEYIHEVAWGGNPDKPVEYHDGKLGISPRRSFEKWVEKRLGYCRPWNNESKLRLFKMRELFIHA